MQDLIKELETYLYSLVKHFLLHATELCNGTPYQPLTQAEIDAVMLKLKDFQIALLESLNLNKFPAGTINGRYYYISQLGILAKVVQNGKTDHIPMNITDAYYGANNDIVIIGIDESKGIDKVINLKANIFNQLLANNLETYLATVEPESNRYKFVTQAYAWYKEKTKEI